MTKKTASTHRTMPVEQETEGKTYYVIDDKKVVWIADQTYQDAQKRKEYVAARRWSRTPTIKEMPSDPAKRSKVIAAAGGATLYSPPPANANGHAPAPPPIEVAPDPDPSPAATGGPSVLEDDVDAPVETHPLDDVEESGGDDEGADVDGDLEADDLDSALGDL